MAATSPAFAPSSESSSVILPGTTASTSTSSNDHMMCDNTAMMQFNVDDHEASANAPTPTRIAIDEPTQGALDALAALASASTAVSSLSSSDPCSHHLAQQITPHQTSSDDDSEIMPPPPPRSPTTMSLHATTGSAPLAPSAATSTAPSFATPSFTFLHESTRFSNPEHTGLGRLRSASNPEGMEKWDLYSRNDRQHFVLPSSILEEELASTRRVLGEVADENGEYDSNNGGGGRMTHGFNLHSLQQESMPETGAANGFQQHWVRRSKRTISRLGTSPDSVSSDLGEDDNPPTPKPTKSNSNKNNSATKSKKKSARSSSSQPPEIISKSPPPHEEDDFDESTLEPEELLRRARSRLLEDLSEGSGGNGASGGLNSDKGSVLILPHSLSKYKEVYNKNGRIGIYTPAERAAIIQKFNAKRARRVWNKKIRYNCRKNLADRRMRVKGRFVKRAVEAANSPPPQEESTAAATETAQMKTDESNAIKAKSTTRSSSPPTSGSPLPTVNEEQPQAMDEDMPDVNDEEAGFEPSDDMPYRRTRRYTIT